MNPKAMLAIALSTVGRACVAATAAKGHALPPWPDSNLLQLAAVSQPRSESLGLTTKVTAAALGVARSLGTATAAALGPPLSAARAITRAVGAAARTRQSELGTEAPLPEASAADPEAEAAAAEEANATVPESEALGPLREVDSNAARPVDPEQTGEKEGLTVPGCYMRMSSGCPERPMRNDVWRHDAWAEKRELLDKSYCQRRKAVWDKYCNSTDAEMAFVPEKLLDA